jgi:hypothetical protein
MPLLPYLIPGMTADRFLIAVVLALVVLFVVGAGREFFTGLRGFRASAEILPIGALAAVVAVGIGALGAHLTGGPGIAQRTSPRSESFGERACGATEPSIDCTVGPQLAPARLHNQIIIQC